MTPQNPGGPRRLVDELLDERALADAGLTTDKDEPAGVGAHFAQMPAQGLELNLSFQDFHDLGNSTHLRSDVACRSTAVRSVRVGYGHFAAAPAQRQAFDDAGPIGGGGA